MNKLIYIIPIFIVMGSINASAQKGIEAVINAEKSFAAYAIEHNTKDAFLRFLDSADAIVFNDGKMNNAFTEWNNAKVNSNKLIWEPAFAGASNAGDLGFTTGPWQFKHSLQDSSLANGEYTTIWHLNSKGEWKFLLDIGTDFNQPTYNVEKIIKWTSGSAINIDGKDAVEIDKTFITSYQTLHNDAFKAVITGDTWFNLQGQKPITGKENILAVLPQIDGNLQFIPLGGGIAASNDLAYVYGMVRAGDKQENYLRIWQKTKTGFVLLLQVLKL